MIIIKSAAHKTRKRGPLTWAPYFPRLVRSSFNCALLQSLQQGACSLRSPTCLEPCSKSRKSNLRHFPGLHLPLPLDRAPRGRRWPLSGYLEQWVHGAYTVRSMSPQACVKNLHGTERRQLQEERKGHGLRSPFVVTKMLRMDVFTI